MKLFLNENLINESNILNEDIQSWYTQNSNVLSNKGISLDKVKELAKVDPTYYKKNGNSKVSEDDLQKEFSNPAKETDSAGNYLKWLLNNYGDENLDYEYKKNIFSILSAYAVLAEIKSGAQGDFLKANNFDSNIDSYKSVDEIDEVIKNIVNKYKQDIKEPTERMRQQHRDSQTEYSPDESKQSEFEKKLSKLLGRMEDAKNMIDGLKKDLFGETSKFLIYTPSSFLHARKLGYLLRTEDNPGTPYICNLCTSNQSGQFDHYLRDYGGRYYMFINKNDYKEKYQLQATSNQFMDVNDHNLISHGPNYGNKSPYNKYTDDIDFWTKNKDAFELLSNNCLPEEKSYFNKINDELIGEEEIENFKNGSGEYIYDEEHKHINNRIIKYIKKLIIKTNLTEALTFGSDSSLIEVEFDDALGMNFNWNNVKFQGSNIKTVKLSSNFQELPDYTFKGCSQLETVVVSGNIGSIGNHCFDNCKMLKNCDGLLNSCTYIGDYAFYNTSIDGKINLNNCTSLGEGAFAQTQITEVYATKLNDIKGYTFAICRQLEKFNFSNIQHIGKRAFMGSNLTGNLKLSNMKIDDCAFTTTSIEKVNINSDIPSECFLGCDKLSWVKILDGCINIGKDAFLGTSLETLTLPGTMKRIKANSLEKIYSLKKVILSDGIEVLEEFCFKDCSNLEKVLIPNSIQRIDDLAFSGCDKVVVYTDSSYAIDFCKEHKIKYINMNESLDSDSEQLILNEDYDILDEDLTSINSFSEIDDAIHQDENVKYILTTRIGDLPDKYKYLAPYYSNITLYDVLKQYFNNNTLIYLDKVGDSYIGCAVAKVNQYSNGISELDFFSFLESDNNIQLLFDLKRLLDELLSNYRYVKFLGNPQSQVNSLYKIIAKKYPCVINEIDSNTTAYTLFADEDDLQDSQD